MAYVAIGILFLLVLGAGITLFVMANAKQSQPSAAEDDEQKVGAPFAGRDHTPLGDTSEHAGEQDEHGRTTSPVGPAGGGSTPGRAVEEPAGGRFKRDPIGGEAEAETTIDVGERGSRT